MGRHTRSNHHKHQYSLCYIQCYIQCCILVLSHNHHSDIASHWLLLYKSWSFHMKHHNIPYHTSTCNDLWYLQLFRISRRRVQKQSLYRIFQSNSYRLPNPSSRSIDNYPCFQLAIRHSNIHFLHIQYCIICHQLHSIHHWSIEDRHNRSYHMCLLVYHYFDIIYHLDLLYMGLVDHKLVLPIRKYICSHSSRSSQLLSREHMLVRLVLQYMELGFHNAFLDNLLCKDIHNFPSAL